MPSQPWLVDNRPALYLYALTRLCRREPWTASEDPVARQWILGHIDRWYLQVSKHFQQDRWELRSSGGSYTNILAQCPVHGLVDVVRTHTAGKIPHGRNDTERLLAREGWPLTMHEGSRHWTPARMIASCDSCPNLLACSLEGVHSA